MHFSKRILGVAFAASLLAGCGGGGSGGSDTVTNNSPTRGTLRVNPPVRTGSFTAGTLTDLLNSQGGQGLLALAGTPVCGVDVHYIQYATVGGAGEATTATGVLMVPTGTAAQCTGPRPVVLYAHGTTTDKTFNLAAINDPTNDAYGNSAILGTMFAAQGYIVVAPNYAGYDASTLGYHPYLNADQQSKDMIDALTAARAALGHIPASGIAENGKLFITGYSQGGHVAMATQQALEALGQTVTASAPSSGPYATEAFGDAVILGSVNIGSTVYIPMITTSYQKSYGGLYTAASDVYMQPYASGIETLLPGTTPLNTIFAQGKLPMLALFNSTPIVTGNASLDAALVPSAISPYALGFGTSYLVKDSVRIAYATDVLASPDGYAQSGAPLATTANYPLRAKLKLNDMRYVRYGSTGFVPQNPTLLCGGAKDPEVFFDINAGTMQAFWAPMNLPAGRVTVLDLEAGVGASDPFSAAKTGFAQAVAATKARAVSYGATDGGAMAVTYAYHGSLVAPYCTLAARTFFSQF